MGRSNPGPSFLRSAGARFTVVRLGGSVMPRLAIAAMTLSLDSLTALSGRPTVVKVGSPRTMSTSTSTE